MGNFGDQWKIGNNIPRVGDAFYIDRLGVLVDRRCESFRILFRYEFDTNAIVLESDLELIECAAIEVRAAPWVRFSPQQTG